MTDKTKAAKKPETIVMFAPAGTEDALAEVSLVARDKAAVEAREVAAWKAFHALLDDIAAGKDRPVVLLFHRGGKMLKTGRTLTTRGAGRDDNYLAALLRANLPTAQYRRLVTEQKVSSVTYHLNEAAIAAEAALDPKIREMVESATNPGTDSVTRVFPDEKHPATAADISAASARLAAENAPTVS